MSSASTLMCPACTFNNASGSASCEMCETPLLVPGGRDAAIAVAPAPAKAAAAATATATAPATAAAAAASMTDGDEGEAEVWRSDAAGGAAASGGGSAGGSSGGGVCGAGAASTSASASAVVAMSDADPSFEIDESWDEATVAQKLRNVILETETEQPDDTPREEYRVTIPGLRKLLASISEAMMTVRANAAKARDDLKSHVDKVVGEAGGMTQDIEADAARLNTEIDDAETRKIQALEKEAVDAEDALTNLERLIETANAALAEYNTRLTTASASAASASASASSAAGGVGGASVGGGSSADVSCAC